MSQSNGSDQPIKKVYIILLNFNGWKDTIECLESVLKSDYENYQIVVVDNESSDHSVEYILDWAKGCQSIVYNETSKLKHLSQPEHLKPIDCPVRTKEDVVTNDSIDIQSHSDDAEPNIVIIRAGENRGFAAGNNIGITYALKQHDMDYVWLLNNDTVVEEISLTHMVNSFDHLIHQSINVGVCGAKLKDYSDPKVVQSIGRSMGLFYKLTPINTDISNVAGECLECDDLSGASLLVSAQFIQKIGLLPEEYFLYMEETDWLYKGKQSGFSYYTSMNGIVYHKESSTTGGRLSVLNIYYNTRNRIHFFRKYGGFYFGVLVPMFFLFKFKDLFRYGFMVRLDLVKALSQGFLDGVLRVYEKRSF